MPAEKGRKLNWREACEILGCGKTHFYTLVRNGQLPAYRLQGGRRRMWVYEKDCEEIMEKVLLPPKLDSVAGR